MMKVDPSQGAHFFHNITSLGIPYITVSEGKDFLDWQKLEARKSTLETLFLRHIQFETPFIIKLDATTSRSVIYSPE